MTVASATPCDGCGFQPPTPSELPAAIRALPSTWAQALRSGGPGIIEEAARSRDELHAVANRVARILVAPGSTLSPVSIATPTEMRRPPTIDLLVELLRMEADRLSGITGSIGAEWGWFGRIGRRNVTVRELTVVPLHTAHRLLISGQGRQTSVVLLDAHRQNAADRGRSTYVRDRAVALEHHRPTGTGY